MDKKLAEELPQGYKALCEDAKESLGR